MRTDLASQSACPGGTVLICALSGLGKSTLAARYQAEVFDADNLLYEAVKIGFPALDARARLRAWRRLCRSRPWETDTDELARWALVRRAYHEPFIDVVSQNRYRLVVTSLMHPPWVVGAFYGIYKGHYGEHLELAGREADNYQDEGLNRRLDGYSPLIRIRPGEYLGDRPEILGLLSEP